MNWHTKDDDDTPEPPPFEPGPLDEPIMEPVDSSNLEAVGSDTITSTLYIEFKTPSLYAFYDVPEDEWKGLMNAPSHGKTCLKYFHYEIHGGVGGGGGPSSFLYEYGGPGSLPGASGPGGRGAGGGLSLLGGMLNIVNCNFSSNTVAGGQGGNGTGGLPSADDAGDSVPAGPGGNGGNALGGAMCITAGNIGATNITCAGNELASGVEGSGGPPGSGTFGGSVPGTNGLPGLVEGDSIAAVQGSFTLLNSILSCAFGETNIFGDIIDAGYNLNSDATSALTNVWSLNGIDPGLGPLGNYGGPTPTIALLAGSPAIDGADPNAFPPTDQRGRHRPYGAAPDIGAFESSPPYVISGNISGLSLAGIIVTAGSNNALTTVTGNYTITGLEPGGYLVSPQSQSYSFTSSSAFVTLTADTFGIDFAASPANPLTLENLANGMVHLRINGISGQSSVIQSSSDLVIWSPVYTNTFDSTNSLEVTFPTNGPAQFYRVLTP